MARGELTRAVELLGLAHTLQGFADTANPEVARVTAAARGTGGLSDPAFAAAYARGRAQTRDDALALTPSRDHRPARRTPAPYSRMASGTRPAR